MQVDWLASQRLVATPLLLACLCAVAGAEAPGGDARAVAEAAQQADASELEDWLVGLDSNRYAERERATDALLAAGAPAVPYLERAAVGESLEAADRAVWVLQQLASTGDRPLRLATLEVLVKSTRFPAIAQQADTALASLQSDICRDRLVGLGAEFIPTVDNNGFLLNAEVVKMHIKVNTNREQWKGTTEDLLMIAKLRHVSKLTVASSLLDDEIVGDIAGMDGLTSLTLIETRVSGKKKQQLNEKYPDLRIIFHSRAKLGVQFYEGQPLSVARVLPNTPAQKAGMQRGDRILKFNDNQVATFPELTVFIAECPPGKTVPIVVERDGEERTLRAQLGGTDWWEELKGHP